MTIHLKCHKGIGPKVQGEALVADDGFSARYDLDRIKRTFSRPDYKLVGQSYVDKILAIIPVIAPSWGPKKRDSFAC